MHDSCVVGGFEGTAADIESLASEASARGVERQKPLPRRLFADALRIGRKRLETPRELTPAELEEIKAFGRAE